MNMTADDIRYLSKAVKTFERAYMVTLKNKKAFQIRLKELETWDNNNGHELERKAKVIALTNLIEN